VTGKNGRILFDRTKPTAGCSANGGGGGGEEGRRKKKKKKKKKKTKKKNSIICRGNTSLIKI
jgi:hypothetical protein